MPTTAADPFFSVVLHGFPGLTFEESCQAEARFKEAITKALGGPEKVQPAHDAFIAIHEHAQTPVDRHQRDRAAVWGVAYGWARQEALKGRSIPEQAFFVFVPF